MNSSQFKQSDKQVIILYFPPCTPNSPTPLKKANKIANQIPSVMACAAIQQEPGTVRRLNI